MEPSVKPSPLIWLACLLVICRIQFIMDQINISKHSTSLKHAIFSVRQQIHLHPVIMPSFAPVVGMHTFSL